MRDKLIWKSRGYVATARNMYINNRSRTHPRRDVISGNRELIWNKDKNLWVMTCWYGTTGALYFSRKQIEG